eukprot:g2222.t1
MLSLPRSSTLLAVAVLCCCGCWHAAHARSVCETHYDRTYPTDMWLEWHSSSGASGRIEYSPGSSGIGGAVPDENGSGGMRRRVVFAPGNVDCQPLPSATNSHRGQAAGVPYKDAFVLFLATRTGRPCIWIDGLTTVPMQAGAAGTMWMYTDEEPETDGMIHPCGYDLTLEPRATRKTIPFATFTRDRPGTHGGMAMAREIMAGHTVNVFWPGTGPIDPEERAALKQLYRDGIALWEWSYLKIGTNGAMYRHTFLANDTVDPCGGSGDPSTRLEGITCIGGRVVNLDFGSFGTTQLRSIPASISKLKHLRSFYFIARQRADDAAVITVPDSFGDLSMLRTFALCGQLGSPGQALALPSTLGNLNNLTMLEIDEFDISGNFPASVFSLPALASVVLNKVPLTSLPAVSAMTALHTFSLSSNGLAVPAPSFKGLSKLESVSFAGNKLTGDSKDMFDGCVSLVAVDVANNRLSCDLPSFKDCTSLTAMKLSGNALKGGVPAEYVALKRVTVLDASHNVIGGKGKSLLTPIKGMEALVRLDLSHNVLEYEIPADLGTGSGLSSLILSCLGVRTRFVDLSHNRLVGIAGLYVSALGQTSHTYPNLVHVYLSYNQLIGWFSIEALGYNLDFSHNNVSGIDITNEAIMQTGSPSQHVPWSRMRFNHQSPPNGTRQRFFRSGVSFSSMDASFIDRDWSLAPFVPGFVFEKIEYPKGSDEFPFSCPRWHARKYPELVWEMDPEVYDYHGGSTAALRHNWISSATDSTDYIAGFEKHFGGTKGFCRCEPGHYGAPPHCFRFASHYSRSDSTGHVADTLFGSGRTKNGLDTAWHIRPDIRAGYHSHPLVFDRSTLAKDDLLVVYAGANKTNERLFSFSASEPPVVGKEYHMVGPDFLTENKEEMVFPPSVGSLEQLKSFIWCGFDVNLDRQSLSLPDAIGQWKQLSAFNVGRVSVPGGISPLLFQLPSLQVILVKDVAMSALPDVSRLTKLTKFIMTGNGITSPTPSFKGLSELEILHLTGNKLSGGYADMFDGCEKLADLDVTSNDLSCELFSFLGCRELRTISMSHNNITGAIPESWRALTKVTKLEAAYNKLGGGGPLSPLSSMTELLKIDLSHNLFEYICPLVHGRFCLMTDWARDFVGSKVIDLDLSHNKFETFFRHTVMFAEVAPIGLRWLNLAHNKFGGVMDTGYLSTNFDISHNRIDRVSTSGWGTKKYGPVKFLKMKMDHQSSNISFGEVNLPTYGGIDNALASVTFATSPFFPTTTFKKYEFPEGSGKFPFSCPTWAGREHREMVWEMDPQVYGYSGGSTAALRERWLGPNDSAGVKAAFRKAFGVRAKGFIADELFGDGRTKDGLDTVWHVHPDPRVGYQSHTLMFDRSNLAKDDLLYVYAGANKTNERLFSFSAAEPPLVGQEYHVVAPDFLLHYVSVDKSGFHFNREGQIQMHRIVPFIHT